MQENSKDAIIQEIIDEMRPAIQAHGGDLHLIRVSDATVYVSLSGACVGCPASSYTLTLGVEENIKLRAPWVAQVIALDNEE